MLSRALCLFQRLDLGNVPTRGREDALRLKLRQWSPFPDTAEYVVWRGRQALVWIWDAAWQQARAEASGSRPVRVLPETLLYPPAADGVRLVRCLEGLEGQYWRDALLWDSHWWPEAPSTAAWWRFQRGCGALLSPPPAPEEMRWMATPWGRSRGRYRWDARGQRSGIIALLVMLACVVGWQAGASWKWRQANAALRERIAALEGQAEPVLKLREQALAYREVVDRLLRLRAYPGQLELMAMVADNLPGQERRLREWQYNLDSLEFVVADPAVEPRQYVEALQAVPQFTEVAAEAGRETGQWRLRLRLRTPGAEQ